MFSVLFASAYTAAAVATLIWFTSFAPFYFLQINNVDVPLCVVTVMCVFFPNIALGYAMKVAVGWEGTGEGLQWSNYAYDFANSFSVLEITAGLLGISVFFFLLTLYIERVFPGAYGIPESWYFPCLIQYWLGTQEDEDVPKAQTHCPWFGPHSDDLAFEPEPIDGVLGVDIQDLRKVYSNGKVACDNLSMNFYVNQITVIIG